MKGIKFLVLVLMVSLIASCGYVRKASDEARYRTITGEESSVTVYNGGEEVAVFENAKITYSDSDSDGIFFKDLNTGNEYYWQDGILIRIK